MVLKIVLEPLCGTADWASANLLPRRGRLAARALAMSRDSSRSNPLTRKDHGEPVPTGRATLCASARTREIPYRRGTGIGAVVVGEISPADTGGPPCRPSGIRPAGCGSRHRFAPRCVQRERTRRREPRPLCAGCSWSSRDTLRHSGGYRPLDGRAHLPRPGRARRG